MALIYEQFLTQTWESILNRLQIYEKVVSKRSPAMLL